VGNKRFMIGGLAAGVVVLAVLPAVADDQSYTAPFGVSSQCAGAPLVVTGDPDIDSNFASVTSPTAFGVGSACYQAPATAIGVTVDVTDNGAELPYQVAFQKADGYTSEIDADGNAVYHDGCGSQSFTIPAGFEGGYVYIFANAGEACPTSKTSTSGNIHTEWVFPPTA
jgi:hypothetical protein